MIEVEHLCKRYGAVEAVRDISFSVERGEVIGFVGPNGAGKTTTLRILAGFIGASSGRVRIGGYDIVEHRARAQQCIGYLPEFCPLYPEMRVSEYLRFRAELKRVRRRRLAAEVERVLGLCGAPQAARVRIGHLSKGYRQRVGLADALLGSPPLLILDEPTASLDPNQMREFRTVLRQLGEEHTIVLSTHILSEVEATCGHAIVISGGELLAQGPLDELRDPRRAVARLDVLVSGDHASALRIVREQSGVADVVLTDSGQPGVGRLRVELQRDDGADGGGPTSADENGEPAASGARDGAGAVAERVAVALVEAGIGLRQLVPVTPTLEQVFAELTHDAARESGDAQSPPEAP